MNCEKLTPSEPLLLSLAEMGIGTLPRSARLNLCWGGANAIGRRALDRLDLPSLWDRAVSDDLSVSRAAHRAGLVIYALKRIPKKSETVDIGPLHIEVLDIDNHRVDQLLVSRRIDPAAGTVPSAS